ncbi:MULTISPECIES: aldehyde dehydrogenase family protein [unclassified Pseudomonas]|uniref:aldehyde dehydrogenase family protein n=1 Tax=unclassified Pseudomonas TaxID=196821 RepID=UPI001B329919|nr:MULTISPECIES: aldehyde dehydrogenase family protein [unclassified Pseudomonas]MBP5946811.1 aldehyde dehydrogenase family protein [Pseudomonas sp. P9(2020)]MBZ9564949.1 aldehyde dehydrogenase family protein [Pseudomonas sp. P116]
MYLIDGQLRDANDLDATLECLQADLADHLSTPLESSTVISAATCFAEQLSGDNQELALDLEQRQALIEFCTAEALQIKLQRELGAQPGSLRRIDYRQSRFECWSPLGLVVHITPGNAPLLAFCAVLESLLAGNVNWLRPSSSDQGLTARLLHALLQCDSSGQLAGYVAVLPVSTGQIGQLCKHANGVAAWGGEPALQAIRKQLPSGCRWIDWGHRISFVYLTPDAATAQNLDAVADEVCRLDQQACSSPQWLLVDSDNPVVLRQIGERLAAAFERRAGRWPALLPTPQEAAQITTHTHMARLAQSFAEQTGHVWSAPGWRVIWAHERQLAPSPLFRSVLLHPVPRQLITETLLPWRNVLQSCALLCGEAQIGELARRLISAGVTRIAPVAGIHDGYDGEPHDGVYALQRLSRRVSVSVAADRLPSHATLDRAPVPAMLCGQPIMDKESLNGQPFNATAQLYFRSGGSSGTPALSGYSYGDFHRQMRATADGLFAAGLDPARDRVMNLFFCGGLYGGFLSFAKVLELLDITHLPMGAPADDDYREIADLIISQRVTVLMGMPSTLHRLFLNERERLQTYGGITKVFLAGEHLSEPSRALLLSCGVTSIRSAIYGSVDAGPLGHACQATGDGIFHLMNDTQHLEIVALDADEPVVGNQVGRLLFTSIAREAQIVQRYDVGDTGRWVPGACACGLASPRFELLQRHGKLIRIGTDFISLSELAVHLQVPFQLLLDHTCDGVERMRLRSELETVDVQARLANYPTLATIIQSRLLNVEVEVCAIKDFTRNKHSGKTPLLIDSRN